MNGCGTCAKMRSVLPQRLRLSLEQLEARRIAAKARKREFKAAVQRARDGVKP